MRHVPLFLSKINVHLYLDFLRKHSFKVCALMWFESPVMRTTVINQFFFFFLQSFWSVLCAEF